ncbi:monovalent cation/H+ antiporter complex subunit F [Georgenia yuyongxinii]|uniref:pH regulation protein F n=1 Tax=Georgenia yuyongxinii TaxID=2589797 RepID=A0A552WW88_9MICO|nr:cation:proton antiporter [Georgenia yuyongxinii]TRW46985.1 pH regulation protein F [Georgenia yuyongxinii]
MTAVYAFCIVVLTVAGVVALIRMERGPTMLDRVVALDVVTAVVLGSIALISASTKRTDLVPVLVVLAIVGFVGSVTIARFVAVERADEARILTKEELRVVLAQQNVIDDEAAPVHDPDAARARDDGAEPGDAGPGDDPAHAGPVDGAGAGPYEEEPPARDGEMGEGARGEGR